jgi:hypothetical protein
MREREMREGLSALPKIIMAEDSLPFAIMIGALFLKDFD